LPVGTGKTPHGLHVPTKVAGRPSKQGGVRLGGAHA
jgi:hypothetical protein